MLCELIIALSVKYKLLCVIDKYVDCLTMSLPHDLHSLFYIHHLYELDLNIVLAFCSDLLTLPTYFFSGYQILPNNTCLRYLTVSFLLRPRLGDHACSPCVVHQCLRGLARWRSLALATIAGWEALGRGKILNFFTLEKSYIII